MTGFDFDSVSKRNLDPLEGLDGGNLLGCEVSTGYEHVVFHYPCGDFAHH